MARVVVRDGEPFDRALRKFTRKVKEEGIMNEIKRREAFETNAEKMKRKQAASRKRSQRLARPTLSEMDTESKFTH